MYNHYHVLSNLMSVSVYNLYYKGLNCHFIFLVAILGKQLEKLNFICMLYRKTYIIYLYTCMSQFMTIKVDKYIYIYLVEFCT